MAADPVKMVAQLAMMSAVERADFYANAVRLGASLDILRILHDHCAPRRTVQFRGAEGDTAPQSSPSAHAGDSK